MEKLSGCIDLSSRVKLRLTGGDRVRYLNGQVTNNVTKANPRTAIYACVPNLKGKIEADVFITQSADGESLLIDGPPELRDHLPLRLGKYLIADDAELEDVSEDYGLLHFPGELPGSLAGHKGLKEANRYGLPGNDLWLGPGEGSGLEEIAKQAGTVPGDTLEETRLLHGVPKWGHELSDDVFPAEAGLEERAVDFHKGCYIGQEVISRIHSVGKVNRVLRALVSDPDSSGGAAGDIQPGMLLFPADPGPGEQKPAGRITSVTFSPALGRAIALAFVRQAFANPGTRLMVGEDQNKLLNALEIRNTPVRI